MHIWLMSVITIFVVWFWSERISEWSRRLFLRAAGIVIACPLVIVEGIPERFPINGWLAVVGGYRWAALAVDPVVSIAAFFTAAWLVLLPAALIARSEHWTVRRASSIAGLFCGLLVVAGLTFAAPGIDVKSEPLSLESSKPFDIGKNVTESKELRSDSRSNAAPLAVWVVKSVSAVIVGNETVQGPVDGQFEIVGAPGALPPAMNVVFINERSGQRYPVVREGDGSFLLNAQGRLGDRYVVGVIPGDAPRISTVRQSKD